MTNQELQCMIVEALGEPSANPHGFWKWAETHIQEFNQEDDLLESAKIFSEMMMVGSGKWLRIPGYRLCIYERLLKKDI